VLGVVAAAISWLLGITVTVVRWVALRLVPNSVVRPAIGGLIFGVIGVLLRLTLASGKEQLSVATGDVGNLGAALVIAVVLAKIVAIAVSLATGFIGGPVMPALFVGGTAGIAIHLLFPDLPLALTFSAMLVAVPGTATKAPFTMVFLAALTVGVGAADGAPAGVAVVVAYLMTSGLGLFGVPMSRAADPDGDHQVVFRDELFEDGRSPPCECHDRSRRFSTIGRVPGKGQSPGRQIAVTPGTDPRRDGGRGEPGRQPGPRRGRRFQHDGSPSARGGHRVRKRTLTRGGLVARSGGAIGLRQFGNHDAPHGRGVGGTTVSGES